MAEKGRLTVDQKVKVVLFYAETKSAVATQRRFRAHIGTSWAPCKQTIYRLLLGTIFQPMRINSVPDVKCFCNNKNVLCVQWMVWHFMRHPVLSMSKRQWWAAVCWNCGNWTGIHGNDDIKLNESRWISWLYDLLWFYVQRLYSTRTIQVLFDCIWESDVALYSALLEELYDLTCNDEVESVSDYLLRVSQDGKLTVLSTVTWTKQMTRGQNVMFTSNLSRPMVSDKVFVCQTKFFKKKYIPNIIITNFYCS